MSDERFQQLDALFQQARRLAPSERSAFLDDACAGDNQLRADVDALLNEYDAPSEDFLAEPPASSYAASGASAPLPSQIGRYRIVRQIGEGGMAVVYLAQQDRTDRPVALKIIKPTFSTDRARRRFELEGQVLGRLRHPGIAQIYEAGIHQDASHRFPYIAMELVEGRSLTEHSRQLNTTERLALFLKVCDAVQHAHLNSVVHRDLKPANILVIDDGNADRGKHVGQPKILDFGIARAIDSDVQVTTQQTDLGALVGTLQYMSPEQAAGDPNAIDSRSDVYALGVILFELLTEALPYNLDGRMILEAVRVIRQDDPRSLSSVNRVFKGDLETIVSKALEKDPDLRYQGAGSLAADIRRYLDNEPIEAKRDSGWYVVRKTIRRHRVAVLVIVAFVLTVSASAIGLGVMYNRQKRQTALAQQAEAQANQRFAQVKELAGAFIFELDPKIRHLVGATPAREFVVNKGLDYLDRLSEGSSGDRELQRVLGQAYISVGDIQGHPETANLGDLAGAETSYRRAIAILKEAAEAHPGDAAIQRGLSLAHNQFGQLLRSTDRKDEAIRHYNLALAISEKLARAHPDVDDYQRDLAFAYDMIGYRLAEDGRLDEAIESYEKGRDLTRHLVEKSPKDRRFRRDLAVSHHKIGNVQLAKGEPEKALESHRKYLEIAQELLSEEPASAVAQRDTCTGYERIGFILQREGRLHEALDAYRQGRQTGESLVKADPFDQRAKRDLGTNHCRIGEIQLALGDVEDAKKSFAAYNSVAREIATDNPDRSAAQRELGVSYYKMAELHMALGNDDDASAESRVAEWRMARQWLQRTLEVFETMRDNKTLAQSDRNVPEDMAQAIDKCDAAIESLGARSDLVTEADRAPR